MIIYHGSYLEVESPDIVHSRPRVDFGRGFYATPIREQAENWCGKFLRQGKAGIVNQYEFSEEKLAEFQVLTLREILGRHGGFYFELPQRKRHERV